MPPLASDFVMLDLVYNNVIQHRALLKVDVPAMMVKIESVLSTPPTLERSEDKLGPSTESIPILPAPPAPLTADFMVVTDPGSSTLIIEPAHLTITIDFRFSKTTPLKTPFLKIASSASLVVIPTVRVTYNDHASTDFSFNTTPPLLEVDFKDEFVEELIDRFYKSLSVVSQ